MDIPEWFPDQMLLCEKQGNKATFAEKNRGLPTVSVRVRGGRADAAQRRRRRRVWRHAQRPRARQRARLCRRRGECGGAVQARPL